MHLVSYGTNGSPMARSAHMQANAATGSIRVPFIFRFSERLDGFSESTTGITHYACQNEQTRLQRLNGVGCVLNRRIRKMIYHLGGKPLTRRRAVGPRFRDKAEQNQPPRHVARPRLRKEAPLAARPAFAGP